MGLPDTYMHTRVSYTTEPVVYHNNQYIMQLITVTSYFSCRKLEDFAIPRNAYYYFTVNGAKLVFPAPSVGDIEVCINPRVKISNHEVVRAVGYERDVTFDGSPLSMIYFPFAPTEIKDAGNYDGLVVFYNHLVSVEIHP